MKPSGTDCSDTISLETPPTSQRRRFFFTCAEHTFLQQPASYAICIQRYPGKQLALLYCIGRSIYRGKSKQAPSESKVPVYKFRLRDVPEQRLALQPDYSVFTILSTLLAAAAGCQTGQSQQRKRSGGGFGNEVSFSQHSGLSQC